MAGRKVEIPNQLSLCTVEIYILFLEKYSSLFLWNSPASHVLFHVVCEASLASVSPDLLYTPMVLMWKQHF